MFHRGNIPWDKGYTKKTHPGLSKMSHTLSAKKEWNFSRWKRQQPKIDYSVDESEKWAELVGITLGDGNISLFPRTERLRIACNARDAKYVYHIRDLVKIVLKKIPVVKKRESINCIDISIYQRNLSKRLRMPAGNKVINGVGIPKRIYNDRKLFISCLKGLFETDGSLVVDKGNYTRVIELKNLSQPLLKNVYYGLKRLNYNPQLGKNYVRLARKDQVYSFANLIQFRKY